MDFDQQIDALQKHLDVFLETREDALWLLDFIQQKVKTHFPDEQLVQQEESRERTGNQIDIWAKMRVDCYSSVADFDRSLLLHSVMKLMLS